MALRNVIMPDGHIISNVPEDVTDEEDVAKYNKKKTAEEEKRKMAEDYSAKKRALARGGSRMLLAEGRLSPETGIEDDTKTTLGAEYGWRS